MQRAARQLGCTAAKTPNAERESAARSAWLGVARSIPSDARPAPLDLALTACFAFQVYESCFGPDVVREIRQEMRAASAKCQERGPSMGPGLEPGAAFALDRLDRPGPQPLQSLHRPAKQPQQGQQADSARLQQALMAVLNRQAVSSGVFTSRCAIGSISRLSSPARGWPNLTWTRTAEARTRARFHFFHPLAARPRGRDPPRARGDLCQREDW